MTIERNGSGELFFYKSAWRDRIETWHIYPSGEPLLREHKIVEGMELPRELFKKLKAERHLYQHFTTPDSTKPTKPFRRPTVTEEERADGTRVFTVRNARQPEPTEPKLPVQQSWRR